MSSKERQRGAPKYFVHALNFRYFVGFRILEYAAAIDPEPGEAQIVGHGYSVTEGLRQRFKLNTGSVSCFVRSGYQT